MVGCRHNAKNTLVKNYLYLAEKWGAEVEAEAEVRDIVPLAAGQPDGARYEVVYRSASALLFKGERRVRTRNVIAAAGALGTLRLLFRCRDVTRSLPDISPRLGELVRTNNESLLGVIARDDKADYSQGIAITSILHADPITTIEPVRYSAGSSVMRFSPARSSTAGAACPGWCGRWRNSSRGPRTLPAPISGRGGRSGPQSSWSCRPRIPSSASGSGGAS